jgi:hypothetical protein
MGTTKGILKRSVDERWGDGRDSASLSLAPFLVGNGRAPGDSPRKRWMERR